MDPYRTACWRTMRCAHFVKNSEDFKCTPLCPWPVPTGTSEARVGGNSSRCSQSNTHLGCSRASSAQPTQNFSLERPTPTLPQQLPVNPGSLDDNTMNLFRQMMQAQDEQIRAQAAQVQQLTNLVKDLAVLDVQNASQTATSAAATPASSSGDTSGPAPMDVDTGIRSRRARTTFRLQPQLNFASMNTRHAEIRVWSAYKEELTSWLHLLSDVSQKNLTSQSRAPSQYSKVLWTLGRLRGPASFGSCFVRV